jgi:putative membrane protein
MYSFEMRKGFWSEAVAIQGSVTLQVLPSIGACGVIAVAVCGVKIFLQQKLDIHLNLDISPFGFAGAVLAILLVIRLNAGYDRWWEARTRWGGIVNQSRNLAISGLAYGPDNAQWRVKFICYVAAFSYASRDQLRGDLLSPQYERLIAMAGGKSHTAITHRPNHIALQLGDCLRDAMESFNINGFAFMQMDRERKVLVDHFGACERILATPLPRIYSITIRRFIFLFIFILPIALYQQLGSLVQVPVITMLVAYPLLTLDQIGVELENPFSELSLSHLPLDEIAAKIEFNVLELLQQTQSERA